jgi:hypothetical protein
VLSRAAATLLPVSPLRGWDVYSVASGYRGLTPPGYIISLLRSLKPAVANPMLLEEPNLKTCDSRLVCRGFRVVIEFAFLIGSPI